jgi:hypothetical protein
MQRSMAWRFDGRLTVVVHSAKNPSNLEWQNMLRDVDARGAVVNGRGLIVSYGGGPDGRQRQALGPQILRTPLPTCMMTTDGLTRAIMSALLVFNRNMKVLGIEERKVAYDFLGLSAQEREAADRIRGDLEQELGVGSARVNQQHP